MVERFETIRLVGGRLSEEDFEGLLALRRDGLLDATRARQPLSARIHPNSPCRYHRGMATPV
jgi:hypothetical protein